MSGSVGFGSLDQDTPSGSIQPRHRATTHSEAPTTVPATRPASVPIRDWTTTRVALPASAQVA